MPILLATIMLLLVACEKDDESTTPPVIYDFVTAITNSDKVVSNIKTDDGKLWNLSNKITTDVSDSIIRCLCGYADEDGIMKVYYIKSLFSNYPVPAERFKIRPTDPVDIVSLWNSGGYVNMHLGIKTTGASSHSFAFSQDSIKDRRVFVTVIHQQPKDDAESYTGNVYLSMPLTNYADHDSVTICINTYDGLRTKTFSIK